jgi:hypothetical protein
MRSEDTTALTNSHIERGARGTFGFRTQVVSVYIHLSEESDRNRAKRALTPSDDETDCRVRATDNTERRKVPHVIVVCDCQQQTATM